MRLTIDNLDGAGAVDYSIALGAEKPLRIVRKLNAPSVCSGSLQLDGTALRLPARRGRLVVSNDAGTVLFTGYVATEPALVYEGQASAGAVHHAVFSAVSDEWLLDKQSAFPSGSGLAQGSGTLMRSLAGRVDDAVVSTGGVTGGNTVGVFVPSADAGWSANAGALAGQAYSAYRVVNGALAMPAAGSVTHTLHEGDGTLDVGALQAAVVKELANDVTVSGEMEPAALIQEVFYGDAGTAQFTLSTPPFHGAHTTVLSDSFDRAVLNARRWDVVDPGSHLGISSSGLLLSGGNGFDGQTTLTAIDLVELGGALVLEAGSVRLNTGSDGVLCGIYNGATSIANCFAGFRVRQSGGTTVLAALLNGGEVGSTMTIATGHLYTLRLRVHCVEMQRVLQSYYAMVDGAVVEFGGGLVDAPASVVFEVTDLGLASNTPATVLYDGQVASSPAKCSFVAVNSVNLLGSVGYFRVRQEGSAWIVSTLPDGSRVTRLIGAAGEGVDCAMDPSGKILFFAGRIPVAAELVTVSYRGSQRSVARLEDAVSVAAETGAGLPGAQRWVGHVAQPATRSSLDCENAAAAMLSFSTSRAAAWSGKYSTENGEDIWPGDVLAITSDAQTMNVMVREVVLDDRHAAPEILRYTVSFANDWAESLGMKLTEKLAADAVLPLGAMNSPGRALANLRRLSLVSASTTTLHVDAGVAAPAGGGFEVRRRDWDFGAAVDQDLVLRSSVAVFDIPRAAQVERYYVRMFDASGTYSRFSTAIYTHVPVG